MNKFPDNFLFGTATAALQIEGGDTNNNWYRWSEQGMIENKEHCITACDHWNRIEEDTELNAALNVQTYRLGLEWSRIEPEEGKFNKEAILKYRYEIELLLEKNIHPLVTLWHFSHPLWFEDDGNWTNPKSIERYLSYTTYVINELGDIVTDWITFNEPNVFLTFAYFEGKWPPGKKGEIGMYLTCASHIIEAHVNAYKIIHEIVKEKSNKSAVVGVAHHLRIFDPYNNGLLTKLGIYLIEKLFHNIFIEGTTEGKFLFPVKNKSGIKQGKYVDFFGINYYSRDFIKGKFDPKNMFCEILLNEKCETNDLNWEIYAEGIGRLCKRFYEKYQLPIYITENGTCDAKDNFRQKYIKDHLSELLKQINNGVDIQRFYYWCLMDNFEWTEGYAPRFGLYEVNFENQERKLRASGEYYKQVCTTKTL